MPTPRDRPPGGTAADRRHVRRGLVLVAGAVVLLVAVQPLGPLPFAWLPVVAGGVFLLAAAAGGRQSPFWTAGLVVAAWGLGGVLDAALQPAWSGALPLLLLGAGALLAARLGSSGFPTGAADVGRAVVFLGVGQLLRITTGDLVTAIFVGLIAGWGLWEALSRLALRAGGSQPESGRA